MISKQSACGYIRRFSGLPGCAAGTLTDELVLAYLKVCRDDDHAQAVTDWLIRTCDFCPTPAKIYTASEAVASQHIVDFQPDRTPGEKLSLESLVQDMTQDDLRRWEKMALSGSHSARTLAKQWVEAYYRQHG